MRHAPAFDTLMPIAATSNLVVGMAGRLNSQHRCIMSTGRLQDVGHSNEVREGCGALVLHTYHDCSARQGCSTGILAVYLKFVVSPEEACWFTLSLGYCVNWSLLLSDFLSSGDSITVEFR